MINLAVVVLGRINTEWVIPSRDLISIKKYANINELFECN